MPPRKLARASDDWLFPKAAPSQGGDDQSSLLDVVDSILNKGAVINGDVILGVANVDLVYAKLSVLIAALDRIMKPTGRGTSKKRRRSPKPKTSASR
jgi:hypothetical protein